MAQWIARRTSNPEVVGSSPTRDAIFFPQNFLSNCKVLLEICRFYPEFVSRILFQKQIYKEINVNFVLDLISRSLVLAGVDQNTFRFSRHVCAC